MAERAFHCQRTSSSSLLPDPESPPPPSDSASLKQQQASLHKRARLPTAANGREQLTKISQEEEDGGKVDKYGEDEREKLGVAWCQLSVQPEHSFILSLYFLLCLVLLSFRLPVIDSN